ncbi:MAG: hypothetical protein ACFFAN_05695 [Promethearchaeota archaeon]
MNFYIFCIYESSFFLITAALALGAISVQMRTIFIAIKEADFSKCGKKQ